MSRRFSKDVDLNQKTRTITSVIGSLTLPALIASRLMRRGLLQAFCSGVRHGQPCHVEGCGSQQDHHGGGLQGEAPVTAFKSLVSVNLF